MNACSVGRIVRKASEEAILRKCKMLKQLWAPTELLERKKCGLRRAPGMLPRQSSWSCDPSARCRARKRMTASASSWFGPPGAVPPSSRARRDRQARVPPRRGVVAAPEGASRAVQPRPRRRRAHGDRARHGARASMREHVDASVRAGPSGSSCSRSAATAAFAPTGVPRCAATTRSRWMLRPSCTASTRWKCPARRRELALLDRARERGSCGEPPSAEPSPPSPKGDLGALFGSGRRGGGHGYRLAQLPSPRLGAAQLTRWRISPRLTWPHRYVYAATPTGPSSGGWESASSSA